MQVMSPDWLLEVARGNVHGAYLVHKFGSNKAIGTTWSTITTSGVYQTPTTAQSLEIVSDNINDTFTGSGARTVIVEGLDSNWDLIKETVNMNGIVPVTLSNQFMRVFRMRVSSSGTYSGLVGGSHSGNISLQGVGSGPIYATIVIENGQPLGASEIGAYSVPRGYTAYIVDLQVIAESTKVVDAALMIRDSIDVIAAPYASSYIIDIIHDVTDMNIQASHRGFSQPIVGPADIGFIGSTVSGNAKASVHFDLLIIDNNTRDQIGAS